MLCLSGCASVALALWCRVPSCMRAGALVAASIELYTVRFGEEAGQRHWHACACVTGTCAPGTAKREEGKSYALILIVIAHACHRPITCADGGHA